MSVSGESPNVGDKNPIDVSHLPLADLLQSNDSALTASLRRLLVELDDPPESFAAFGNTP